MAVNCPLCRAEVSDTEVYAVIAGVRVRCFQCDQCPKQTGRDIFTFVILPDGTKVSAADAENCLEVLAARTRNTRAKTL